MVRDESRVGSSERLSNLLLWLLVEREELIVVKSFCCKCVMIILFVMCLLRSVEVVLVLIDGQDRKYEAA